MRKCIIFLLCMLPLFGRAVQNDVVLVSDTAATFEGRIGTNEADIAVLETNALLKTGGTMSGDIDMGGNTISNATLEGDISGGTNLPISGLRDGTNVTLLSNYTTYTNAQDAIDTNQNGRLDLVEGEVDVLNTNTAPLQSFLGVSNRVGDVEAEVDILNTNTAPLQSYLATSNALDDVEANQTSISNAYPVIEGSANIHVTLTATGQVVSVDVGAVSYGTTDSTAYRGDWGASVSNTASAALPKAGGTMTGDLAHGGYSATGLNNVTSTNVITGKSLSLTGGDSAKWLKGDGTESSEVVTNNETGLTLGGDFTSTGTLDGDEATDFHDATQLTGNIAGARLTNALPWDGSDDWTGTFDGQEGSWYRDWANVTNHDAVDQAIIDASAGTNFISTNTLQDQIDVNVGNITTNADNLDAVSNAYPVIEGSANVHVTLTDTGQVVSVDAGSVSYGTTDTTAYRGDWGASVSNTASAALPKTGGTMSGDLNHGGYSATNLNNVVLTNQLQVESQNTNSVRIAVSYGFGKQIELRGNPSYNADANYEPHYGWYELRTNTFNETVGDFLGFSPVPESEVWEDTPLSFSNAMILTRTGNELRLGVGRWPNHPVDVRGIIGGDGLQLYGAANFGGYSATALNNVTLTNAISAKSIALTGGDMNGGGGKGTNFGTLQTTNLTMAGGDIDGGGGSATNLDDVTAAGTVQGEFLHAKMGVAGYPLRFYTDATGVSNWSFYVSDSTFYLYGPNSEAGNAFGIEEFTNLWVRGFVSGISFIDRTPYPDTLDIARDAINSMTSKAIGKGVDHGKLHPFIKGGADGRNLSATVSALVRLIQYLNTKVEDYENRIKTLEEK